MHIRIGRFAAGELEGRDAERPDVDALVVLVLGNDLRGHPVGRPDKGFALRLLRRQLRRDAKVGQFDLAFIGEKNIRRLDVTVDLALAVEVIQG